MIGALHGLWLMNLKTQGYFSDCASDEWVWLTRILTDVQHIVDTAVSIAQGALVGGGAAILVLGSFVSIRGLIAAVFPCLMLSLSEEGEESLPQLFMFNSRDFLNARMEFGIEVIYSSGSHFEGALFARRL